MIEESLLLPAVVVFVRRTKPSAAAAGRGGEAAVVSVSVMDNNSLSLAAEEEEEEEEENFRYGTLHRPVKYALPTPCHGSAMQVHPSAASHGRLGPQQACPHVGARGALLAVSRLLADEGGLLDEEAASSRSR